MLLEKEAVAFQEELLQKERKWRKEAEDLKENIFRAERKEEEARREEEEKWKAKLDEVLKVKGTRFGFSGPQFVPTFPQTYTYLSNEVYFIIAVNRR